MPATALRRPITITLWLGLSVTCLVLAPVLLALGALASALLRRPQPLVMARLLIAYFARELAVLVACGALWLASGAGSRIGSRRMQLLHFGLLRWFARGVVGRALELLEITVEAEPTHEAARALASERPLLIFSRHAGPGDTVTLVDLLLTRFRRLPSVVFKHTLTLDPCIDLIGHRLPHAILDTSEPEDCEAQIEAVAAGLMSRGVLLLFPEGGNFTHERRREALRKLRRKGRHREAARAEQMSHVLPPHPGGALAALRGNRSADVIFTAHTGLGLAAFPRELWRKLPIGGTLRVGMWLVPAAERPSDPDEQVKWLYEWWKRLDDWIGEHGSDREPPAA